jgi:hypothetical protein
MRLELKAQAAFFMHFNGRSELHGEERQPAGDIKFRVTTTNNVLDQLHKTLKHALFFHDVNDPGRDLADKAMEDNPDHLPHKRFPELEGPVKWAGEMVGGKLTVHYGLGGKSDIVLPDIKLNKVAIHPKDGGTVEVEFRVQAHPDEKQAGKLYALIQKEVTITVEPPQAQDDLVGQAQAPAAAPASTSTEVATV